MSVQEPNTVYLLLVPEEKYIKQINDGLYALLLHSFEVGKVKAQYAWQGGWLTLSNHSLHDDIYTATKTMHVN